MEVRALILAVTAEAADILRKLGVEFEFFEHGSMTAHSPITGEIIGRVRARDRAASRKAVIARRRRTHFASGAMPRRPRRGEFVRLLGEELRAAKHELARLVTIEAGKIISESLGEVQEMIDICDYAVGLSRQLYGLTIATERPDHRMMETWHPLGVSASSPASTFRWPCGPGMQRLRWSAEIRLSGSPRKRRHLPRLQRKRCSTRRGAFWRCPRRAVQRACGWTGTRRHSCRRSIGFESCPLPAPPPWVAPSRHVLRSGLHGLFWSLAATTPAIVCPSASLDLAVRAIAFAAMGTAGQRCTTLRRLIVHEDIYDELLGRLRSAYASVSVGDPREDGTLVGPLIDQRAYRRCGRRSTKPARSGAIIGRRALVHGQISRRLLREASACRNRRTGAGRATGNLRTNSLRDELIDTSIEAIRLHNGVPHGLASSIFTNDICEAERFLSAEGSDCGIANVNIGPSGAEIGGAFGGEKDSGRRARSRLRFLEGLYAPRYQYDQLLQAICPSRRA